MEPITREEMYLASAAGEYSGELPEPKTRLEYYLKKIKEAVENGSSVAPEDIDAAIEAYLNSHDADIVTEAELTQALAGYYDKTEIDTALGGKAAADHNHSGVYAPASHTHAQSDITGLSDALAGKASVSHEHDDRYYTETEMDAALAGKAAVSHAHDDRYYTETEIDNKLGEKSNTGHTHDDRYYTEDETDTLLSGKADSSDIPDVSAFITRLVNDLVNYYTKSETYTKAEIDSKVSAIPKFAIEVVNSLPVQDISDTTVYLLTVQNGEQGNMYDEYIYVGNTWEKLGTQTIDLSGYYTAAEVDALLSNLSVSGHTHDDRYYTETEIDGKIQTINTALSGKAASDHTHDDRYYTETEIDNKLSVKSNTGHSHMQSDITGLDSALAGKAAASHTHPAMTGADSNTAGTAGLVPAPAAGDNGKFLRGDGTWVRSLTIDQVYPVGSIYMSVNSTSPSTLFGGTWERLKNIFPLGASEYYPAGTTGGEVEHTLSEAELPPHRHPSIFNFSGSGDFFATVGAGTASDASTSGYGGYAGSGQAHNNMPPYLAVYMWKRTA